MKKLIALLLIVAVMTALCLTVSAENPMLKDMDSWTLIDQYERDADYDVQMRLDPKTQTLYGVLIGHDGSIPGGCVVIPCEGERFAGYFRTETRHYVVWYGDEKVIIDVYEKRWGVLGREEFKNFHFRDVPKGSYYELPVTWARTQNITNGTTGTTFSPDATCTRGQIVTFLWRLAGCPEPQTDKNPFKDVKENAFYYKPVLWAVEKGITKGTTETTFCPEDTCSRAQIVTFLWRASGRPKSQGTSFKDVSENSYYADAVSWAANKGITKGKGSLFSPDDPCTRAEAVTFLFRASWPKV